jgi:hypothetical protein
MIKGKEGAVYALAWHEIRKARRGYFVGDRPFRHQGEGKAYTYKLFLEQSHALLRVGGRVGLIIPSNIYTDKGATALRKLLLDSCKWVWLFGMINWEKVFSSIYYRFKFCPIIVERGGHTDAICAAFTRYDVGDWEASRPPHLLISLR